MATLDLTPVLQPLLEIAGIVVTGMITIYGPKALAAFQERTKIQLTENQRQTILGAVQTAAGKLETQLDQGVIKAGHITVNNPVVAKEAQAAINSVPAAMVALDMTTDKIAGMIVGAVNTGAHGDASGTTVEVVPAQAPQKVVLTQ
jgi:hypothetical protein